MNPTRTRMRQIQEGRPRCCITETGQGYFQNLAIADFPVMKGYRGSDFGLSPDFIWKRMQPNPEGAAARLFQYPRPVSTAYFWQLTGRMK